jgi:methyl coenzyme M reductase alpha subunit
MMKRMIGSFVLALCVPALFAQTPDAKKPAMMPECAAMMQQHDAMQRHMTEMDVKLQTLVDQMNKAKGPARVDSMAAVITELVAQRAMMQKQMADMQPMMMEHMMEHMKSGATEMADSMADCPMMKKSEKAQTPPAAEHQH